MIMFHKGSRGKKRSREKEGEESKNGKNGSCVKCTANPSRYRVGAIPYTRASDQDSVLQNARVHSQIVAFESILLLFLLGPMPFS